MICEYCGNLDIDCECEDDPVESLSDDDCGDDEWTHGYDGDAL